MLNRGPIAWMASHHVAANLIMVACIIGGLMFMQDIKKEVFPSFNIEMVEVAVAYPGASPEEVESGIILPLEEALGSLDGFDSMTSRAGEGLGSVRMEAQTGTNIEKLAQDVQAEVDRIITFPEGAEKPSVNVPSMRRKVLSVVVYGDTNTANLDQLAEQLRYNLLQSDDITQVEIDGIPPLEISIEIPQHNLRRYGLTLDKIANTLRATSLDVPSGSIKTSGGEILIRMSERRDTGKQFGDIAIISNADGSEVKLSDIATIQDGYEDNDLYAKYNAEHAVMLDVYRVGDQTPTDISRIVREKLGGYQSGLPPGIETDVLDDRSKIFQQRLDLLLKNSALGLVLVLILLSLFLELRLAFWVMMGIPISFLGSFLILPLFDVSINMISMFAFIIALGIVVDDAIVVGENIYHYRQQGLSGVEASIAGAKEVATPVTFSILTNIATFMPLAFVPGVMGKVFAVIPFVVISVFILSLIESLFVLPSHLNQRRGAKRSELGGWIHNKQQNFSQGFVHWIERNYVPVLKLALNNRYLTLAIAVGLFILTLAYAASGRMGMEVFPKTDSDFAVATLSLPYGSPVEQTEAIVDQLLNEANSIAEKNPGLVTDTYALVGKGGAHNANVRIYLAEPHIRESIMSTNDFTNLWRKQIGEIPGVESLVFTADFGGPGSGKSVTVELSHDDHEILKQASTELAEELKAFPIVKDVDDGFAPGKQQLDFSINALGKSLGLTPRSISTQVRNAYFGAEVLRQQRGRSEIKIKLRLPKSERVTEYDLDELIIQTPKGMEVPLRDVVEISKGRAYTSINRRNSRRVVEVTAETNPRAKANEVITVIKEENLPKLMQKYPGLSYSMEGRSAEMMKSLGSLGPMFAMAMVVIYAMLAIPFRSYLQPMIVLMSVPFGIIGAIYGHLLMGYNLSVISMMGVVALSGIVVNDSLVLINYANILQRRKHLSSFEVIVQAAKQRFRPIFLTTMTTFLGLFPMILETSRQAKMLIPMALSIGFGILFATTIILLLIPAFYLVVEDIKKLFGFSAENEEQSTESLLKETATE